MPYKPDHSDTDFKYDASNRVICSNTDVGGGLLSYPVYQ